VEKERERQKMSYRKHLMTSDEPPSELYKAAEVGTNMASLGTDCISRQQAIDAIEHITTSMSICVNSDECHGMKRMQRQAVIELVNMPTIQPKRGKWIEIETFDDSRYMKCDQCKTVQVFYYGKRNTNYCPNCGADMRGEQDG
jgi:hypothetical protein